MTIGGSLTVLAVGAILRYAVNDTWDAVNLETVGLILMIAGAIGFVIGVGVLFSGGRTSRPPSGPR